MGLDERREEGIWEKGGVCGDSGSMHNTTLEEREVFSSLSFDVMMSTLQPLSPTQLSEEADKEKRGGEVNIEAVNGGEADTATLELLMQLEGLVEGERRWGLEEASSTNEQ